MFFRIVYACIIPPLRLFFRIAFFARAYGRENVPKSGGLIACANHKSNFDPVLLAAFIPRKLRFLAKRELFKNSIFGWLIGGLGAVPITRGGSDIGTLKTVITLLKNGDVMTVFPEGTRNVEDIENVKSGAVMFAIKGQVPIQPAVIVGDYKPFCGLKIIFGKPIYYTDYYNRRVSQDELHSLSVDLMKQIYSLAEGK